MLATVSFPLYGASLVRDFSEILVKHCQTRLCGGRRVDLGASICCISCKYLENILGKTHIKKKTLLGNKYLGQKTLSAR